MFIRNEKTSMQNQQVQEMQPSATRIVSDIHGHISSSEVHEVLCPTSIAEVVAAVHSAIRSGRPISVAGGRHAMGGQQFGNGTTLLDMSSLDQVVDIDLIRGEVEALAGIQWPRLMERLQTAQTGRPWQWGIIQKQTGADRFSLGGSLSSNIHGRGLTMRPIADNVIAFTLVNAAGEVVRCDRHQNSDLFGLVIGGYGLFGIIVSVRLKLARRTKVQRVVELINVDRAIDAFAERVADGFTFGDFQFAIDPTGDDFLKTGVFSCYRPVSDDVPIPSDQRVLSTADWAELLYLGHVDKRQAVDRYTGHYRLTDGQIYWSDLQQRSEYLDGYHVALDRAMAAEHSCSEVITELYVPREKLVEFFDQARVLILRDKIDVIYGTVRLIEQDRETFLAWARESFACIIFNLHTVHSQAGIESSRAAFTALIDIAIGLGGSYYLTYHRFVRQDQVLACYPQFPAFLAEKERRDPGGIFQSDWYRHYQEMFVGTLPPAGTR